MKYVKRLYSQSVVLLFTAAAPTPLFATSNTNQTAGAAFGGINTGQNTAFNSTFGSAQSNQVMQKRNKRNSVICYQL